MPAPKQAGLTNKDYDAQKILLRKVDTEEIPMEEFFKCGRHMLDLMVAGKDPMEPPPEDGEPAT